MEWTDDIRIETPEQIDVSLEIAGLGSRFVAQILDWLIKWGILVVVVLVGAIALSLLGASLASMSASMLVLALLVGLFYAFLLGFDIYFELRHNGQTPGKRRAGIRVIREDGGPLDFRAASVRNLLGIADFLPAGYLLGALLMLLTPRGQRLGDLAAGTLVIRERALRPPADLEQQIQRLADDKFTFTPEHLRACSPGDRVILRSFFQRSREMDTDAREELAFRLTDTFVEKMAYQRAELIQDTRDAATFLACLYRDLENWAKHGG